MNMTAEWEVFLDRWTQAGLLDTAAAGRIRAWEAEHERPRRWRWPVSIALAFGALLIGAGALLFVSAHWDELPASGRMALVLVLVAIFHVSGAFSAERFHGLSIALHTIGTALLGAGIALTGQIFNLSEHWPSAVLLWTGGAALAWALLRHWTQGALTAILLPFWVGSEAYVRAFQNPHGFTPIAAGVCALSATYLTASRTSNDTALRQALTWIGGIALVPSVCFIAFEQAYWSGVAAEWAFAILVPLALAFLLRGRDAIWNAAACFWILILAAIADGRGGNLAVYAWCALGAVGLVAWGVWDVRSERINLGSFGFALTVLAYYFSNVMDKLNRSASLIFLGIVFLGGGWLLERMRRKLIARIRPEGA